MIRIDRQQAFDRCHARFNDAVARFRPVPAARLSIATFFRCFFLVCLASVQVSPSIFLPSSQDALPVDDVSNE